MNRRRISALLSPKARKIPISLVRALTDMYMVTMIISAETIREMAAMAARMEEAK